MFVPTSRAAIVSLFGELAPKVGAEHVLVAWDEDDLFDGVYRGWAEIAGGYEVHDRVQGLTMPEVQAIWDEARRARPVEYHDARHASGRVRDAARPDKPGHHVRYLGRGRHR